MIDKLLKYLDRKRVMIIFALLLSIACIYNLIGGRYSLAIFEWFGSAILLHFSEKD